MLRTTELNTNRTQTATLLETANANKYDNANRYDNHKLIDVLTINQFIYK